MCLRSKRQTADASKQNKKPQNRRRNIHHDSCHEQLFSCSLQVREYHAFFYFSGNSSEGHHPPSVSAVVESLVKPSEVGDFSSQLKPYVSGGAAHHGEEILQDAVLPGSCRACKWVVGKVKTMMGKDSSKVIE
ncbi:Hypothetical protein SMAX5B_000404 [Scophthalmus maximus]|uniref:Uncharacterized protein n=1 Tax=Scophthalmus maximus TaxID=52904 RepID=A0A2U9CKV5_SCOMX|nr:Hypothetical protein SMAX5B_000404 [Scophthalmus maximus]